MEEKLQEEKKQRLEEENERSHACDASVSLLRNRNELLRKRKSDLEQQRAEKSGAVGVLETEKEEKAAILAQSKEAVRKLKAEIRARTAEYEKTQKTRGDEAEVLASALGLLETEDRDLLTEAKEQVEATRTEDSADSNASDSSEETTESQGESLKSLQDSDSTSRSPKSLQDSEDANESSGASRTEGEEQSEQDAEKDDVEDTATEQGESMTSTSGAEEEVNKDAKQDERKARRKLKVVEQNRRGGEKKNRTSSSKSASSSSDSKRTRKTDRRRRERRGGKKLRLLASRWSSTSSFEDGGSPDAAASSLVDGLFSSSVFLQQQQSRNNKEVLLRAAAFLREQTAGKRNAVAFLAEELQSNAEKGDGAFDRIKAMLSDTIHRLSKEAAAAANKEQWCVREIGNNKADLQDIEEREKDSKARAEEMQSRLAQLVARSKESNKDKRTRQTLWQQQSKQRMDDKKRNLEEAEEMKRAGEKIARARILLQGFYGGQETSGKTSELFALLERLEADYAASLIEATGREVSASAAFGEDRSKFQTEQAALDVRLQHLEATRANVKQEASEKTRDLAMLNYDGQFLLVVLVHFVSCFEALRAARGPTTRNSNPFLVLFNYLSSTRLSLFQHQRNRANSLDKYLFLRGPNNLSFTHHLSSPIHDGLYH
ncbi:unnamed protein product [Amoebophrya sp. A25]|nr:unnamed protein product [Amoebophrya sp. A25]|eukprot:GSA25T00006275001.1